MVQASSRGQASHQGTIPRVCEERFNAYPAVWAAVPELRLSYHSMIRRCSRSHGSLAMEGQPPLPWLPPKTKAAVADYPQPSSEDGLLGFLRQPASCKSCGRDPYTGARHPSRVTQRSMHRSFRFASLVWARVLGSSKDMDPDRKNLVTALPLH